MDIREYLKRVVTALDQLFNTICLGNPDETLSSRCYRLSDKYWYANIGMKIIDFICRPCGKEHCYNAYLDEVNRRHL